MYAPYANFVSVVYTAADGIGVKSATPETFGKNVPGLQRTCWHHWIDINNVFSNRVTGDPFQRGYLGHMRNRLGNTKIREDFATFREIGDMLAQKARPGFSMRNGDWFNPPGLAKAVKAKFDCMTKMSKAGTAKKAMQETQYLELWQLLYQVGRTCCAFINESVQLMMLCFARCDVCKEHSGESGVSLRFYMEAVLDTGAFTSGWKQY